MKARYYKLLFLIIILVLAAGSCRKAGSWLVKSDTPRHADAMIMLMGGVPSDRILQVSDLYEQNMSGRVWVVEEGSGARNILAERGVQIISNTDQVHGALISLGLPEDSIVILPGGARSTQMEAGIVRDYLATRAGIDALAGIDTLLVVSSAPHMRRASMIFKAAVRTLDEAPVICACPSSYSSFNAKRWWRNREDIQDVLFEYLKILNFVLFEKRDLK